MEGSTMLLMLLIAGFVAVVIYGFWAAKPYKPGERRAGKGGRDAQIVCPHCQSRGNVATRQVKLKRGVSGGKATTALLTGGLSLLAVGLSKKERATEAKCSNCGSLWHF
jgi:DNA-directed RNA polymerase subunit RPC12/RpoP